MFRFGVCGDYLIVCILNAIYMLSLAEECELLRGPETDGNVKSQLQYVPKYIAPTKLSVKFATTCQDINR